MKAGRGEAALIDGLGLSALLLVTFVTLRPTKEAIRTLLHLFLTSGDTEEEEEEDSEQSEVFGPTLNDGDKSESVQMSHWIFFFFFGGVALLDPGLSVRASVGTGGNFWAHSTSSTIRPDVHSRK